MLTLGQFGPQPPFSCHFSAHWPFPRDYSARRQFQSFLSTQWPLLCAFYRYHESCKHSTIFFFIQGVNKYFFSPDRIKSNLNFGLELIRTEIERHFFFFFTRGKVVSTVLEICWEMPSYAALGTSCRSMNLDVDLQNLLKLSQTLKLEGLTCTIV